MVRPTPLFSRIPSASLSLRYAQFSKEASQPSCRARILHRYKAFGERIGSGRWQTFQSFRIRRYLASINFWPCWRIALATIGSKKASAGGRLTSKIT